MKRCTGLRGAEQILLNLRMGIVHRFAANFVAIGQAVGADKFNVGDADKAQHHFQVILVSYAGFLTRMKATGGRYHY